LRDQAFNVPSSLPFLRPEPEVSKRLRLGAMLARWGAG
jgi:hypothetical protein